MCELFAACAKNKIALNEHLRAFFAHANKHPDGWGIAVFHDGAVSIEKEPENATKSSYLKNKLRFKIEEPVLLAHIRRATIGNTDYENCHPFVKRERLGRAWTLIHNGTIFSAPALNAYVHTQDGRTDSERILCWFVDRLSDASVALDRELTFEERFALVEGLIGELSDGNKTNLIFYDGEYLYAHSNYANSLHVCEIEPEALIFATVPINQKYWTPIPFTTLCAYKDGKLVKKGNAHNKVFVDNPDDMKYLFMDFAGL